MKRRSTIPRFSPAARSRRRGFSLIELMISMAVLAVMLLFFATMTETVSSTWTSSEARVETHQTARAALELMTREMTPAVVDTRMQFAVMPGSALELNAGVDKIALESPAAFWIAPLGPKGDLRCVGYYLYRDDERYLFRLKRFAIAPDNDDQYFPRIFSENDGNASEFDRTDAAENIFTSPVDASWFFGIPGDPSRNPWDAVAFNDDDPDNESAVVATVSDGVLALWFQCVDTLGNPIPWVSESPVHDQPVDPLDGLIFNSAAFFQMATTLPYQVGNKEATTVYLAGTAGGQRLAMKANRVPAAVDIGIIVVDTRILARRPVIPNQQNILLEDNDETAFDEFGVLDMGASIQLFLDELAEQNVTTARTFTTRVKLINGT